MMDFDSFLYYFLIAVGLLGSLLGRFLLEYPQFVWKSLIQTDSLHFYSLQLLANHQIIGILLAAFCFILLTYLSILTAFELRSHWLQLKWPLRLFALIWVFLLFLSALINSSLIFYISGYIFSFSLLVAILSLLYNYFGHI